MAELFREGMRNEEKNWRERGLQRMKSRNSLSRKTVTVRLQFYFFEFSFSVECFFCCECQIDESYMRTETGLKRYCARSRCKRPEYDLWSFYCIQTTRSCRRNLVFVLRIRIECQKSWKIYQRSKIKELGIAKRPQTSKIKKYWRKWISMWKK